MPRTGAELVVEALVGAGVRHLFSLSGNQILSVYDATIGRGLSIVHTRHEAGAVHMADAWGRLTEEPGVALVTAGPGHLNAVSALYGASMAESPVVFLSGHAPLGQVGPGRLPGDGPGRRGASGDQGGVGGEGRGATRRRHPDRARDRPAAVVRGPST